MIQKKAILKEKGFSKEGIFFGACWTLRRPFSGFAKLRYAYTVTTSLVFRFKIDKISWILKIDGARNL